MFKFDENVFEDMLKTYGRTKESLDEDITVLREWMKEQPHLPEILDDKRLKNFLLLNKCSVERAKQKIDNYYTIRPFVPEIFETMSPQLPHFKRSIENIYCVMLPETTKEHYRAFFHKLINKNSDEYDPKALVQRLLQLQEIRLCEDHMFGDIIIVDAEGATLGHVLKITPPFLAKAYTVYEKVFSVPLKAVYILNSFPAIDMVLQILKKIMKPKLFQRIHVCSDASVLNEILKKDQIPADYGGTGKTLAELQETTNLKLNEFQSRFDQLNAFKVDVNLRPEKLENDEFLGFYGNFKKLNID